MKAVIGISTSLTSDRDNYAAASFSRLIHQAGGEAILLPYDFEEISLLDGVIFSGGGDLLPKYAEYDKPEMALEGIEERDIAEKSLFQLAWDHKLPMLGICRGHQLLTAMTEGSLIADLPAAGYKEQHQLKSEERHSIIFERESLAEQLLPERVWSTHHQAVDRPGRGFRVTARSPEGVVEAVEHETRPILGVQTHPECMGIIEPFMWLITQAKEHVR